METREFPCHDRQCINDGEHGSWCYYWKPKVVCLCGSTRFKEAYDKASYAEGIAGKIVLSVVCFPRKEDGSWDNSKITDEQKVFLDQLHFKKIDLADEVLILNVGGYVGESTANEIAHAKRRKKKIRWLEEPNQCEPEPVYTAKRDRG